MSRLMILTDWGCGVALLTVMLSKAVLGSVLRSQDISVHGSQL